MLTIEPGTPLMRRPHLVPSEDASSDLWLNGRDFLNNHGYNDYEISNFTKDFKCYHNERYWELSPYIGIGPGAVGTLPLKNGEAIRIEGRKQLNQWAIISDSEELYKCEKISKEDFLFEHFMMGWRTEKGINTKVLAERFGSLHLEIIETIEKEFPGTIIQNGDYLFLENNTRLKLDQYLIRIMQFQERNKY